LAGAHQTAPTCADCWRSRETGPHAATRREPFAITAAGAAALTEWVTDLVRESAAEYPRFAAGLDYLTALPQVDAVAALRSRGEALTDEVERRRAETTTATEKLARRGLGRVYDLEDEYRLAMVEAELAWLRSLLAEFETGALDDDHWRGHHAGESGR
jgi:hypothetical protein